jgi:iron complex outermembrane recepter protein
VALSIAASASGWQALPGAAFAASASTADNLTLEEVVVTACRRDENLARVPAAITAIGDEALVERLIRTDSDLQLAVPGLTIRQTQGNNSLTYSIRGQTADTFNGSPSAVIAYFNEVPLTISGAASFYDLQSVQVLKGPQGTLFGRNGTGGSMLYTSAKPTDKSEV